MIITDIRYHPYRVPFKRPFTTAHGTLAAREGVIVEVIADDGEAGYGDMAAVTEFGAPDVATLLRAARGVQVEAVGKVPAALLSDIKAGIFGKGVFGDAPRPYLFALETALSSALARGVVGRFGQEPGREGAMWHPAPVAVNATVSAAPIAEAQAAAAAARAVGYRCIKLKVGMLSSDAAEVARILAVRAAIGADAHLRLDANEAWTVSQAADILHEVQGADIQFIEQPVHRSHLAEMRLLRQEVGIPIAADEALTDMGSAQRVLDADAADVLVLKPQMLGGMMATAMLAQQCYPHKKLVITTALETGIGVAATLSIASTLAPHLLECGLATLPLLEDDLIQETLPIEGDTMRAPLAPVTPDWDALARYHLEVDGL